MVVSLHLESHQLSSLFAKGAVSSDKHYFNHSENKDYFKANVDSIIYI